MHEENYLIKSDTLEDIADAIREKKQSQDTIAVSDFANEIENLPSGGKYAPRYISFYNYTGTELDDEIAGLDTSALTETRNMFYNCTNLVGVDLSTFDTSNVTTTSWMFYGCPKLESVDVSGWDTTNVTNANTMFYGCAKLSSIIGLSSLTFPKLTNATNMFAGCGANEIYLHCGETHTVDTTYTFENCTNASLISISGINFTTMVALCNICKNMEQFSVANCTTSSSVNLAYSFNNCSKLQYLDLSWALINSSSNASQLFYGCTSLSHLDIRGMQLSRFSNTNKMFGESSTNGPPDNCEIIVADQTQKDWINTKFSRLTNVKTVAEYEAE